MTKCLVRQVCDKNWHAGANSITKHSELFPEVLKAVNKNGSNEMSEYLKSESMLLSNKPDEITGFSNTIFLEELRIFCPVVYHFVLSACGIQESDVKVKGTAANGVALATAVMCRLRNPKASALVHRASWLVLLQQKQKAVGIFRSRYLFGGSQTTSQPKSPSKRPP